jgi:hypothetical protein
MDVPTNVWHVGWFHLGPRPGAVGNAVIDGHLDSTTGAAIFLDLHNMRVGDRIYVTDRAGIEWSFVVAEMHSYPLADAPLARIFGPTSGRHLNLITRSGTWQAWEHRYDQRLVVFTHLLGCLSADCTSPRSSSSRRSHPDQAAIHVQQCSW